jgi:hypothetical protein
VRVLPVGRGVEGWPELERMASSTMASDGARAARCVVKLGQRVARERWAGRAQL